MGTNDYVGTIVGSDRGVAVLPMESVSSGSANLAWLPGTGGATHRSIRYVVSPSELITEGIRVILHSVPNLEQIETNQAWFWTEWWQSAEEKADAALRAGDVETFNDMGAFLDSL